MDALRFPTLVRCKHCEQIIYGCVCCADFSHPTFGENQRWGTLIDGWIFNHSNCIDLETEHEPRF